MYVCMYGHCFTFYWNPLREELRGAASVGVFLVIVTGLPAQAQP